MLEGIRQLKLKGLESITKEHATYKQFYQACYDVSAYAYGVNNMKLYEWVMHQFDLMYKYQQTHSHAKHVPAKWWTRFVAVIEYEIWKGWD